MMDLDDEEIQESAFIVFVPFAHLGRRFGRSLSIGAHDGARDAESWSYFGGSSELAPLT